MQIRCPSCQRSLTVTNHVAGDEIRCPACRHAFVVTSSDPENEPAAATVPAPSRPAAATPAAPPTSWWDKASTIGGHVAKAMGPLWELIRTIGHFYRDNREQIVGHFVDRTGGDREGSTIRLRLDRDDGDRVTWSEGRWEFELPACCATCGTTDNIAPSSREARLLDVQHLAIVVGVTAGLGLLLALWQGFWLVPLFALLALALGYAMRSEHAGTVLFQHCPKHGDDPRFPDVRLLDADPLVLGIRVGDRSVKQRHQDEVTGHRRPRGETPREPAPASIPVAGGDSDEPPGESIPLAWDEGDDDLAADSFDDGPRRSTEERRHEPGRPSQVPRAEAGDPSLHEDAGSDDLEDQAAPPADSRVSERRSGSRQPAASGAADALAGDLGFQEEGVREEDATTEPPARQRDEQPDAAVARGPAPASVADEPGGTYRLAEPTPEHSAVRPTRPGNETRPASETAPRAETMPGVERRGGRAPAGGVGSPGAGRHSTVPRKTLDSGTHVPFVRPASSDPETETIPLAGDPRLPSSRAESSEGPLERLPKAAGFNKELAETYAIVGLETPAECDACGILLPMMPETEAAPALAVRPLLLQNFLQFVQLLLGVGHVPQPGREDTVAYVRRVLGHLQLRDGIGDDAFLCPRCRGDAGTVALARSVHEAARMGPGWRLARATSDLRRARTDELVRARGVVAEVVASLGTLDPGEPRTQVLALLVERFCDEAERRAGGRVPGDVLAEWRRIAGPRGPHPPHNLVNGSVNVALSRARSERSKVLRERRPWGVVQGIVVAALVAGLGFVAARANLIEETRGRLPPAVSRQIVELEARGEPVRARFEALVADSRESLVGTLPERAGAAYPAIVLGVLLLPVLILACSLLRRLRVSLGGHRRDGSRAPVGGRIVAELLRIATLVAVVLLVPLASWLL